MRDIFLRATPEQDEWVLWLAHGGDPWVNALVQVGIRTFPPAFEAPGFSSVVEACDSTHGTACLCALFSNTRLLCADPTDDERTYLAAAPDASGRCAVFLFNPRQLVLERHWWSSIHDWLASRERDAGAPRDDQTLAVTQAAARAWLVGALRGVGYASAREDVQGASAFHGYSPDVSARGDVLYWLWHHAVAGNRAALTALMERCSHMDDPWISESSAFIGAHAETWSKPFHGLTFDKVRALREALAQECFEGERRDLARPEVVLREPDAHDRFDAWLANPNSNQRERLAGLRAEKRSMLEALYRENPARTIALIRKRLSSKRLQEGVDELLAALATR